MANKLIGRSVGEIAFDAGNAVLLFLLAIITLFPFWNVIVVSISPYHEYAFNPFLLFPKQITFASYQWVFATSQIPRALGITVLITVAGTAVNMTATVGGAYALSKKSLPGRNLILTLILFTMFFQGGLIPYFLQLKRLGLYNNIFAMIFPVALNTWYLIIVKNYFNTVPPSLEESARIDGADDMRILLHIVLPISAPVIATFILFYGVARWNEWWHATLFINDGRLFPLQRVLRDIVVSFAYNQSALINQEDLVRNPTTQEGAKTAIIVIATVPITIVYPFLQKHFAKGVIIGAVKS